MLKKEKNLYSNIRSHQLHSVVCENIGTEGEKLMYTCKRSSIIYRKYKLILSLENHLTRE
jgi:hypothetical protein